MSIQFTADGVEIQSLQEITDELAEGYRGIYGTDINLNPESPDGQRVLIDAKLVADIQSFALDLYNQQDPDFASGQALFSKLKYAGISPRPATKSQVDITVSSSRIMDLPAGYTIVDELGQEWLIESAESVAVGSNTVTFTAKDYGAIEADADTINTPVTIVIGVNSVNNPDPATPGVAEETVEELRIRRTRSVQLPSYTPTGAIFARLANTPGVLDIIVYENDTDTYDAELDLDAHHVWVIIEGGNVSDIAEAMAYTKTAGTGTKGATSGTFNETLERPGGEPFVIEHEMNFDRPTDVPIYIQVTGTRKNPDQPIPWGTISDNLAAKNFLIGNLVVASELYKTAYEAGDNFILYDLEISLDGISWTAQTIDPDYDGKPSLADFSFIEV